MITQKKILISAAEASGDFYASQLAEKLFKKAKNEIKIIGFGGDLLKKAGAELKINLVKYAIVGFIEVLYKFIFLFITYIKAKRILKNEMPDILIVIDYPGFHLKLIRYAKKIKIKKIIYYITPQIWAWNYKRIYEIKKYADVVIVILPFEKEIFGKENINVKYFGHPLAEYLLEKRREKISNKKDFFTLGIFPGSRNNEIKNILPIILKTLKRISEKIEKINFIIFKSHTIDIKLILKYLKLYRDLKIKIVDGDEKINYKIDCAIAKSGTVTLELALLEIPHVIVYRSSYINYFIAKKVVKVKYIGLPNLIAGKKIVEELIQENLNEENLLNEILKIYKEKKYKNNIIKNLKQIKKKLYLKNTVDKIANFILKGQ